MRTDIHFKLKCSVCGELLEADSKKSKTEYNSAHNAEVIMFINPCCVCYRNASEPERLINQLIGSIKAIQKGREKQAKIAQKP